MAKWGLAIQGGGIRGAYAAGAVDVLMEKGIYAPICYGTSAGALIGANYAAKAKGRTIEIMLKAMHDPKFVSFSHFIKKGNFFNFPWLFGDAKTIFPFDDEVFYNSEVDFYAVATNCETGVPTYWNKKDEHFYDGLAASCSLPMFTKKPIMVNGTPCLDGGIVERIPYHKMLEDNVPTILVISTRPRGFRYGDVGSLEKTIVKDRYKKYPTFVECELKNHELYNAHMDELERLEDEGRVIVVWPSKSTDINFFEKRGSKIFPLYELGRKDCEELLDKIEKTID